MNKSSPITPGEILLEDYLKPMGISQNGLARSLGVSPRTVNEIVLGHRGITPEMSLRLGKFFAQSDDFWFSVQATCDFHDLRKVAHKITSAHACAHGAPITCQYPPPTSIFPT